MHKSSKACSIARLLGRIVLPLWMLLAGGLTVHGDVTNAPVVSPVIIYQYFDAVGEVTNVPVVSPVVYYQYFDALTNATYQTVASPSVSYFYQIGNGAGPIVMQGMVTDPTGAGIPGAVVKASVSQSVVAQTTTDSGGHYALPALGVGVYVLQVSEAAHASAARALTLNTATAIENFQLAVLPAAPAVAQTTRQPSSAYTPSPPGPMGSTLKVFDGSQFVPITSGNRPSANLMTIVMTHGWIKTNNPDPAIMDTPFNQWPTNMAALMRANGITPGMANILAWDWRLAAEDTGFGIGDLKEPAFAAGRVPDQGVALGQALTNALGANYTQNLHFIGHSLGALVNSAAINFLHGDRTGGTRQEISTTPWNNAQIHVTLLDEAEIAETIENDFIHALQPPLPVRFTWADNYWTIAGSDLPGAVNAWLGQAPSWPLDATHGYPIVWYSMSITNPFDYYNPLGFGESYEFDLSIGGTSLFPPTGIPPGTMLTQQAPTSQQPDPDPLALVIGALPSQQSSINAASVLEVVNGTITAVGNVTATVESDAQSAGQSIERVFNDTVSEAEQGLNSIVNVFNSSVLKLRLTTGLWSPLGHLSPRGSPQSLGGSPQPQDDSQTDTAAMAWLPIQVPTNAFAMAFDFSVSGDPVEDELVCGINDTNLFSLAAKYIPTNVIATSHLLDVSQWSGQQVELFFGFLGGTSTNATLGIDNIRFYSFPLPSLNVQVAGGSAVLTWPSTTGGYVLECSPTLTGASWQTITNAPVVSGSVYTMTNAVSGGSMFYRLRKQ